MIVHSPRISALYESACHEVAAAGAEMTPAVYAELWELSRRAVETGGDLPAFLAPSVEVGGVTLHRPGVGMLDWMDKTLNPALEGESDVYWVLAMAWALSHAREPDYIRGHSGRRAIHAAVLFFAWRLPWTTTPEELAWGITAVFGGERRVTGRGRVEAGGVDWGSFVAGVANRCKLDPETVAWKMSVEDVSKLAAASETGPGRGNEMKGWHELRAVVDELKAKAKKKKGA